MTTEAMVFASVMQVTERSELRDESGQVSCGSATMFIRE
jgi:hypothetical protein